MSNTHYQDKYRITEARAAWWDYGRATAYFVTISTAKRKRYFGEIANSNMHLSPAGIVADLCWQHLRLSFPDWTFVEYVVMPDHFHGLMVKTNRDHDPAIMTEQAHRNQASGKHYRYRNPGGNTLSSVVGAFKSRVTRHTRRLGHDFAWQSRFHDVIVRDERAFLNITRYIRDNVRRWDDGDHPG